MSMKVHFAVVTVILPHVCNAYKNISISLIACLYYYFSLFGFSHEAMDLIESDLA